MKICRKRWGWNYNISIWNMHVCSIYELIFRVMLFLSFVCKVSMQQIKHKQWHTLSFVYTLYNLISKRKKKLKVFKGTYILVSGKTKDFKNKSLFCADEEVKVPTNLMRFLKVFFFFLLTRCRTELNSRSLIKCPEIFGNSKWLYLRKTDVKCQGLALFVTCHHSLPKIFVFRTH